MGEYKTSLGTIVVPKSIMHDIVLSAIEKTDGKARLGNAKLRVGFLVNDAGNCISYEWNENRLCMEVCIIIQFGNSISRVADQIIEEIFDGCENIIGTVPENIKVIVTGTDSGGKLIRRDIEIERKR